MHPGSSFSIPPFSECMCHLKIKKKKKSEDTFIMWKGFIRIYFVISWLIFDQQSNVTAQPKISKYVLNEGIEHETNIEKKKPNISLYF